jgi:acyl dehydratase
VRFLRPVFIGDTLTATYRIVEHQADRARVVSEVSCVNQQGEEVAAATHLMKVLV